MRRSHEFDFAGLEKHLPVTHFQLVEEQALGGTVCGDCHPALRVGEKLVLWVVAAHLHGVVHNSGNYIPLCPETA